MRFFLISINLAVLGTLIGCATVNRQPAGRKDRDVQFELFGQNPKTEKNFNIELLMLDSISKNVEFQSLSAADPLVSQKIDQWQQQAEEFFFKSAGIISFKVNHQLMQVETKDLKVGFDALTAIDRVVSEEPELRLRKKIEVLAAIMERFKDPVNANLELLLAPFDLIGRLGNHLISKEMKSSSPISPSSFWSPKSKVDMWSGPSDFPFTQMGICTYNGPKKGFGVHLGFKVNCLNKNLKVKFGNEIYSSPLNSRLYHRLGFNVPAIHYIPKLKVQYDRRIFTEFNSRKPQEMKLNLAGRPVVRINMQKLSDLTEVMTKVYLKDGRQIENMDELRQQLLKNCKMLPCSYADENINTEFEQKISVLEFQPSTITESIGDEIGPWGFSNLDHAERAEVRALLILGAWTGNFDLRKDNTRLVWLKTGELKHFISDPGSGLGNSKSLFKTGSRVDEMSWTATVETTKINVYNQATPIVGISGYKELEENEAFRRTNLNDAQWMTSQIMSISEDELSEALAASGLSAAEFLLAREKLVSIRQKFAVDFGLKDKFKNQFRKVNRQMNFDPQTDQIRLKFRDGRQITLENRGYALKDGVLVEPAK